MLTPSEFVKNILKQKVDTSDETEVVRALVAIYATFLCQDPQEGSEFDHMVLDTLELLHPKAENRTVISRRTNIDRRVAFIRNKMLNKEVIVRPLKEGDPKESDFYCPIPEYNVALWIDKS